MKIQLNKRTGTRLIALPKAICDAKGWNEGDDMTLDEFTVPGYIVLRKTADARKQP